MSILLKTVGSAFLVLFLGIVLREVGFRGAKLATLICTVGVLAVCVNGAERVCEIFDKTLVGSASEGATTVMKMLGIGYVSGICSDVCAEFGEASLSNAITLLGKVEILIISVPYIVSIVENGIGLIG